MKQPLHLFLALFALLFVGCGYDDSAIIDRIEDLENNQKTQIATLQQQIDAINTTLPQLQETDAELKEYIESLQTTATNLQQQITATNGDIDELEAQLSTDKADILAQLESAKVTLEAELTQINTTIAALLAKDIELEGKITTLEEYVNTELQNTEDWATATFATLEQYNTIVEDIATIKTQIETLNTSLTNLEERLNSKIATDIATAVEGLQGELATKVTEITAAYTDAISIAKEEVTVAYTEAIATSIANLEISMKAWVNEQLAGYYTIAEVDAALDILQNSLDEDNKALQEDIEELSTKVDNMKAELTDAYTKAIDEAINTNNGVIDGKIAEEIAAVNGRIDSEVAAINARIDALEERIEDLEEALDKIKALDIVFDIESGKACMAGASIEFGYTIVGGDEDSEVESFGDRGWGADVIATDATSGRIRVTAPKDGGNGKVIVLATSGAGASTMKSIRFEEGVLTDILDSYEVDWEACTLAVRLKTNVDYEVRILAEAQLWLSVADTRAEVRQETLTFSISENPEDSPERTAVVELVNSCGEVLQSFEIVQKIQPSSDPIQFADQYVKKVCIEKFDTNGDGELSYLEASKVTSIGGYFFGDYAPAVKSFDELQYFVNVTSIGYNAFRDCLSLTSITIPDSVTTIGGSAFENCPNLKRVDISNLSVWYKISFESYGNPLCNGANLYVNNELVTDIVIPSDITSVNPSLFRGCTSIRSVVIPEGVTSIGNVAFCDCSSLTSIIIPESVTSIGYGAFYGCTSLTSITIPESVASIGESVFGGCTSLASITIPDSVTLIGDGVFNGCSSLTSITIPEGVVSIENDAFSGCSSLTSITIPEGVVSIGSHAFRDCSSLTSITIPESVIEIGQWAFYGCSSLISLTLPEGVVSIGEYTFSCCSSLSSITIPEGVTSIGQWAFSSCSSLTSITIPEGVTSIGERAFTSCSSLTSITIPESVTAIGYCAFAYCLSLTSITIPEGVTAIGYSAFAYCSSLESVYCKAIMPPVAGSSVFLFNASGRKIYVPMESVDAYKNASGWSQYVSDIVGYDFDNGVEVE